ncbi:glycoside hydrolase N-terminal domain-containing protein [Cellulophaga sp. L1A9]|uniref:glycoside hydrolase family 95 protein n=1 Tax=Cellulophaga sp. L1A9 TaxID=2686362 RepID=UPI00131A6B16|nr:glycoside hydrolase family 95 protein [Cellulophaga sp. L1A9]
MNKALIFFYLFTMVPMQTMSQTVLKYDKPASKFTVDQRGNPNTLGYMQEALPLGNGRLGAMFSGGVDREHLMINDITLWMNSKRGLDANEQSGSRIGAYKNFEKVRESYEQGIYGTSENSMESMSTKYLSSTQPLGNYAPFADLYIATGHDSSVVSNYKRSLDARSGLGLVSYDIKEAHFTREYFCSFPNDIISVRYTAQNAKMQLNIHVSTLLKLIDIKAEGNYIVLNGEAPMVKDNMAFQQLIYIDAGNGKLIPQADGSIQIKNATDVKIYLTGYSDYLPIYPSFKGRDYKSDSKLSIESAVGLGYEKLKQAHVKDISELMDRCQLELDYKPSELTTDKLVKRGSSIELENLYFNYSRYLQISSSRRAPVPSNLQGLWNGHLKPAWHSDYHNDINVAMNYWMVETANLPNSFSPYVEWMKILSESGKYVAKETYGIDKGWSVGLNGNIFGFTAPNEHGRRMQQSGAWLCQNLFEHYAFNQDKSYLEAVYPILKGAAEFYVEFLAPWKDGTLLVYPTWSPENSYLTEEQGKLNKQAYGASWDQQLVLNLFTDCIEAATVLGRDEEFKKKLQEIIPKLSPQKIGQYGQVQEWPEDWDSPTDQHRHISHLIALHPGRDFSPLTTKEITAAALVTMKHRGDISTGWSTAWKTNFWARLHNGYKAHQFYQFLTSERAYPNLFDFHPPFQIDGNFGGTAGVCEMLLQSHLRSINNNAQTIENAAFVAYEKRFEDANHFTPVVPDQKLVNAPYILHLLPALPSAWDNGKIKGLRARGGFEVDLSWEKEELIAAKVYATTDGNFRIYSDGLLSEVIALKKGESIIWKDHKITSQIKIKF